MTALFHDFRFAFRSLLRRPLLSGVVLLTLTLGIGANVAIFSLVRSVLLDSLSYPQPSELVTLWQDETRRDGPEQEWTSWDNFADWREQGTSFEEMAAIGGFRPTLTGVGDPETLNGSAASYTLLPLLGVEPMLGSGFTAEMDQANAEPVVMLGHELWQRRFGGDTGVIGRNLMLQGQSTRVVGVLPPSFEMPITGAGDVLRPLGIDATNSCGRACITLRVVARLDEGVSLERAQEEMIAVSKRLEEEHPRANQGVQVSIVPLHELVTGSVRTPLLILLAAVGLVLLVCCGNVANLLLARAHERQGELALRTALGAGRLQLVRQMFAESLVLSLVGGALGTLAAILAVRQLAHRLAGQLPRVEGAEVDSWILLFALAISVLAGLLFGIVPALRSAATGLAQSMQQGLGARNTGRLRSSLVVAEVALALVLLLAAGLLLRSFLALVSVDLGFRSEQTLMARVSLPQSDYPERPERIAFAAAARERLAALPGVQSVSHTMSPPLAGFDGDTNFSIQGQPRDPGDQPPVAWVRAVDKDYFRNLGIAVIRGRGFEAQDHAESSDVVVLNEAAVRRYFDSQDPVGQRIEFGNDPPRWREIVGTVADTQHFGITEAPRPAAYFPFEQSPVSTMFFLMRTTGDPHEITGGVRSTIAELDPNLAIAQVQTLDELVRGATASERLLAWLLGGFSAASLLVAMIGLYGVMSYSVAQRRREIGIRMAIGAKRQDLIGLVLRQGLGLVLLGTVIGLAAAFAAGRLIAGVLYSVAPYDPVTFVAVPLLLMLVAIAAIWLPARRAAASNLVDTLRVE